MSAGDAREGIIRGKAARARLGGKLAGLSLPRQIAVIAFWPFLEQLLSFFVTSSDLFIATKIGVDAQDTINISDGMGAVVFIMWFGFVIQGSIMMGATAIVSRMTGARDYPRPSMACTRPPCWGSWQEPSPADFSSHAAISWSCTY